MSRTRRQRRQAPGREDLRGVAAEGDPEFAWRWPPDEWEAISLNYTSGTTGNPKGVVYHHRGAYLNAVGNILVWGMPHHSVYLWTLPMFHCNGWCFPWTMAANAGTNVCLRKVEAERDLQAHQAHQVTHYCGAPIVHQMLINAPEELKRGIEHKVSGLVAGGRAAGGDDRGHAEDGLQHHARLRPDRDLRPGDRVRQAPGVGAPAARRPGAPERPPGRPLHGRGGAHGDGPGDHEAGARRRRDHGRDHVPRQHHHEGLPQEPEGHAGGVRRRLVPFRRPRGDAARRLRQDQGPLQGRHHLGRREHLLARGRGRALPPPGGAGRRGGRRPDPKWGETPCAFVELKPGRAVSETEIIEFCRAQMAKFKAPRAVVFGELPKTSTGKIQKFVLREKAKSTAAIDTHERRPSNQTSPSCCAKTATASAR